MRGHQDPRHLARCGSEGILAAHAGRLHGERDREGVSSEPDQSVRRALHRVEEPASEIVERPRDDHLDLVVHEGVISNIRS